jgi:glycosyltransferase involved in cell wall biosynthesis
MSRNVLELPVLTVVIPNHNYSKWIVEAIMSVATDPYPLKRVFVVDDGSTDNSWTVICKAIGQADNTQLFQQGRILETDVLAYRSAKAGGPSAARNIGIRATWDYTHIYGFLDADDIYLPGKISQSINCFMQEPKRIGAIYTDYDTIDVETNTKVRVYKEPYSRQRLLQSCIVHSACMINKLALDRCGVYDEELRVAEDYDLWLRISEKFVISHIPESLMLVRVGSYNSTNTVDSGVWQRCHDRVRQKLMQRMYG